MAAVASYNVRMPKFTRGGTIQAEDDQIAEFYKQLVGAETSAEPWAELLRPTAEIEERKARGAAAGISEREEERATTLLSLQQAFAAQTELRKAKAAGDAEKAKGIGYALLAKAGWTGGGLGAQEQGITTPIPAWHQKGRRGIGAASGKPPKQSSSAATAPAAAAAASGQAPLRGQQRGGGRAASTQSLGVGDICTGAPQQKQASGQQQQRGKPPRAPKREWQTVAVLEDQEVKVKRIKQVAQAEMDDAAEKALARALYRAFNDSSGYGSTDTNPLLRRSKLSDSNPLL